MAQTTIIDARIGALHPSKTAYDIRDAGLKGFEIRTLPSGRKRSHGALDQSETSERPQHAPREQDRRDAC